MFTVNSFAQILGQDHPLLGQVLSGMHRAEVELARQLAVSEATMREVELADRNAQLTSEIADMQREWLESSAEISRQHDHNLRAVVESYEGRLREARRYFDASTYAVMLPYSGQVPEVLEGCRLPLLRIRWQEGQPNGEGEMPVPAGWVLDDDQAGTWLDYVNGRSVQG